ncbi:glycosyltransferase family 4 protein [Sphingomonas sp. URHD0057]|uniref:glycosyltransferase family 4 protein n=1 Tax=Sphingomonas sp. URHD0057 TaxID=1380389 RepID=UPI00049133B4|nr:glycosyltransferase family 4 protein [Sphingomonas sp. URHD0057]
MAAAPRNVVLTANGLWNIVNFRAGLIRALKEAGYKPVVVAPAEAAVQGRMAEFGIEHVELGIDRSGLNPVADFQLYRSYRKLFSQIRPVAVLGFTIKPNIYGSLAASGLGIPAFPNVSGLGTAFIRGGLLQMLVSRLYRRAFSKCGTIFFQNPDDRRLFVDLGIVRPQQTKLLPGSGIDLERFAPAPQPDGPPVFLLISRLLGDKGVREYVAAARQLRRQMPQARFQLLGPIDEGNRTGIQRAELDGWIADGVVEYLGTTDDVRPQIAAASAVVLPSYREGLPRSLLEGAAMGRPLIATDVPGCREVVADGINGYLCAPRDPGSLAQAMGKLAELPQSERRAMGEASRQLVQERFSEAVVIRAYLDELARLGASPS